jgi:hypothetical protein
VSDRPDDAADRRTGSAAAILVAGTILALAVVVVLILTQLPKWTCHPPSGLWNGAAGRCIELP